MVKIFKTWHEKKIIIDEAYSKPRNIRPTALKYNVEPSNIRRWKKTFEELQMENLVSPHENRLMKKKCLSNGPSRKIKQEHFEHLMLFLENMQIQERVVTARLLVHELILLDSSYQDTSILTLSNRIYRWLKHENIVHRRATHVTQNIAFDEAVKSDFVRYVNSRIESDDFAPSAVVNIDETCVKFNMTGSVTLEPQGSRTVCMNTTGSSGRCTVLLGVTLDGTKLPPFVVFEGKPNDRIARDWEGVDSTFPSEIVYTVQENAWVDTDIFSEWIERVWKPFCVSRPKTYLIMDKFSVHMTSSVAKQLSEMKTEIDFVVGGYTSQLQVLDVGINTPFKHYVREAYSNLMISDPASEEIKHIDVARWIDYAWQKISTETIRNTWDHIGIKKT